MPELETFYKFKIGEQDVDGTTAIKGWVSNRLDKLAVDYAEKFGSYLATCEKKHRLTTSQIRNVFGEVRRIQMKSNESWDSVEQSVLLLKPKLAYAAKRAEAKGASALEKVLSAGLDEVFNGSNNDEKMQRFQRFADFFEAVLAYHKAHEKTEQGE